jgi:dTDP-4-dehydrorhamnose reductase
MRILLTGANGQFGRMFLRHAGDHEVFAAYHTEPPIGWQGPALRLDLDHPASIDAALAWAQPDWVVHAAAMTNVDACERDAAAAMRVNGVAPGLVAQATTRLGARMLLVSTDYVFDGTQAPYRESDLPAPIQEYGKSKLAGETAALAACPDAVVARTSVVYGPDKKNFVTWLAGELRAGRRVQIVDDQWITPTHTLDLVEQVLALLGAKAHGIYHSAGGQGCSRLEMAHAVATEFGLDPGLIQPTHSADLAWTARRPRDSRLDTTKISRLKRPWSLQHALRRLRGELA